MYAEESLAFCSGQCQASRFPPASCRCICQGRNHGILRYRNPVIHVREYEPSPFTVPDRVIPLLPEKRLELTAQTIARDLDVQYRPVENLASSSGHGTIPLVVKKGKARRFLKAITGYKSQNDLNEAVLKGLRYQFNAERVEAIVDQAFSIRQSQNPLANRPELYELYETGEIDKATEFFGSRWVIGRPKIRN